MIYVPARNTSKRCSICGYETLECTDRMVWCMKCHALVDRDVNAARNILAKGGLRFEPGGLPVEAMVSVKR